MSTLFLELTPELLSLVKTVLKAISWVETVHPIVTGYQRKILAEISATHPDTGRSITDPELSYLLNEEQAARYYGRCVEEAAKKGLKHKPGCCPLLEAESMEREAKQLLCEYILPRIPGYEGISYHALCKFVEREDGEYVRDKFGRYVFLKDRFVDITLKYLVPQMAEELKEMGRSFKNE